MTKEDRLTRDRAKILWCVHVLGPDDLIAKASYDEAEKHATELRDFMYGPAMPFGEFAPMCLPIVAMWPYSVDAHAKALAEERVSELPSKPSDGSNG